MDRSARSRLLDALPWLALVAFATALALQKIRSNDYWWHLRAGQWIAENRDVPTADPFTYTVAGERWIDIHWLHQLALYGTERLAGHEGVVVAKLVLVLLLVFVLARSGVRRERPLVGVVAIGLALVVVSTRIMPRPELPSFVLLAAELALFERFRHKPDGWIYAVVALQIVWVNLHGLFALGIALGAIYLAAELMRPIGAPGRGLRSRRVLRLLGVSGTAIAASLLNPNGIEGALYPLQQLQMVAPPEQRGVLGSIINELTPLVGGRAAPAPLFDAALVALCAGAFVSMALNLRRLSPGDPLLFAAFGYLALGAHRNAALFAIVAATIWIRNWSEARAETPPHPLRERALATSLALLLSVGVVDLLRDDFYPRVGAQRETGFGVVESFHPGAAVEWIGRTQPAAPIAHQLSVGGYLLWHLYPEYRPMIDGRLEVYGPERLLELWLREPADLLALDRRYRFGSVLLHYAIEPSEALLGWLHKNPEWRLQFVDDSAAVFVRADATRPESLREVDIDAPGLFAPPAEEPSLSDRRRRVGQARFYAALGREQRALEAWEALLERYPDEPRGSFRHAALLLAAGQTDRAERRLREAVEEAPEDLELLAAAARLMQLGGLHEAARRYDAQARKRSRRAAAAGAESRWERVSASLPLVALGSGLAGSLSALLAQRAAARRRGESED